MLETIVNNQFIPTHHVNGEFVDKPDFFWTIELKRNFEIYFKTKKLLVMSLDENKIFYVHNWKSSKQMWDTLEMINMVSLGVEHEKMNTRGEEVIKQIYPSTVLFNEL